VAQSRKVPVRITDVSGEHTLAVANTALQGFRASFGKGARYCAEQQQLLLSPQFATALALQEGDFARFINLDQR
jgi:arginine N-succinyltransferase